MKYNKYEFQVFDGFAMYNVLKVNGEYALYDELEKAVSIFYSVNDDPTNWINVTERIPYKQKKEKLNLPIVYRNIHFPEELRLLVKGSKGMVSVFEEGSFSADEWTKEQVKENIKSGLWLVQSSGNVSCAYDDNGEEY